MRLAELNELKELHPRVVHTAPSVLSPEKTPEEIREEFLVSKAGEYELQAVCADCFLTKAEMQRSAYFPNK